MSKDFDKTLTAMLSGYRQLALWTHGSTWIGLDKHDMTRSTIGRDTHEGNVLST